MILCSNFKSHNKSKAWIALVILALVVTFLLISKTSISSLFPKILFNSQNTTPASDLNGSNPTYLPLVNLQKEAYFVSPNGSDSNPGTVNKPWRTLSHAAERINAGDTLYIRGGTYHESFIIYNSGTQTSPIVVTNYSNEEVIIDGMNMTFPAHKSGTPLIELVGDWITVSNLTVSNSGEYGVTIEGNHDVLDNLYVHHSWGNGVTLQGNYALAQNMRLWSNSMKNEGGILPVSWGAGITCARYPDYCTIRKSVSWDNWGEGISTFEALHTTIEDNISYNNMSNYYISDTKYTVVQRNLAYYTPGTVMDFTITCGILVGDELGVPIPLGSRGTRYPSSDNIFINNILIGGNHTLMTDTSVNTNNLFANNTFSNSDGNTNEPVNVLLNPGTCTNCRFINNIVIQNDDRQIISVEGTGFILSNNLWSKTPPHEASGPGDIIGDPRFAQIGDPYSPEWFKLTSISPAIGSGLTLPEVTGDYFNKIRSAPPDIGAIEFLIPP